MATARQAADEDDRTWRNRSHGVAKLAVWVYLAGALSTTIVTWNLRYEDWYLYALMSLCTAIVVANYARLGIRRTWIRRFLAMAFSCLVVVAWSALLFEKTQVGWTIVNDGAVDRGAQGLFWLPIGFSALTVGLLVSHFFMWMPRARHEAGL